MSGELELAIKYGKILLIENVGEKLSPEFDYVLTPQFRTRGKLKLLKFGDKEVE